MEYTQNENPERILETMHTFDREFLDHLGEDAIHNEEIYADYSRVLLRLDELYATRVWNHDEDAKEIKLEILEALSTIEKKYGFNARPIQKMIL